MGYNCDYNNNKIYTLTSNKEAYLELNGELIFYKGSRIYQNVDGIFYENGKKIPDFKEKRLSEIIKIIIAYNEK